MEQPQPQPQPTEPTTKPCWSTLVKQPAPQRPAPENPVPSLTSQLVPKTGGGGIAVAVVDANAIIQGGERLSSMSDKFVSIQEVIDEIRDPTSRHRLSLLPFDIHTSHPSPDALNKVISFARATGDLQTLSDVDLKLIALTYTLEAQIHGTSHLRDTPPPIHTVNVRRLPEKELPGWGDNVPNLEEWEALEKDAEKSKSVNSKILPLKDLSLNIPVEDRVSLENGSEGQGGQQVEADQNNRRPRKYMPKKREVNTEGKMVAEGVDASGGQCEDDESGGDWRPAVSRSTHRRFLRRKARRDLSEAASLKDDEELLDAGNTDEKDSAAAEAEGNVIEVANGGEDVSSILDQMRLDEEAAEEMDGEEEELDNSLVEVESIDAHELDDEDLDHPENGSVDTSFVEDDASEQSWMLRSLSDSSVACVTGDFAMQNVILQMGLRLVAPGGMQIRELHRWVLKCHACNNVTAEIGRIFCPKCGNGGTLRKVAVTVGENGVVVAARKPRISLRGTKFSLPMPKGGRDAVTKNPVLREDQLPQRMLHPKTKKKSNQEDDFFVGNVIFNHHTDKRTPHRPPVRQALAVFSGKRNPNDNHYSRAKH